MRFDEYGHHLGSSTRYVYIKYLLQYDIGNIQRNRKHIFVRRWDTIQCSNILTFQSSRTTYHRHHPNLA